MKRRGFLAVSGLSLLAGCIGESDESQPNQTVGSTTQTGTRSATPQTEPPANTPPESETPEETDTPQETETPDESDSTDESDSSDESETPDEPNPQLESIATDVTDAIDTYVDSGSDDSGFLDVRPDVRVSETNIRSPLFDARDTRGEVDRSELPPDEQTRYDQLEGAYWFAWWLPSAHGGLYDTWREIRGGWSDLLTKNWENAESKFSNVSSVLDEAESAIENLESDSESSDMNALDRLSPDDHTEKLNQFEALAADLAEFDDPMVAIADGFQLYESGGENDYFNAERKFGDAVDMLEERDWDPILTSLADDAVCVAEAMASGCELLDRAQRTADEERSEGLREDAQAEFDACDIVDDDINIIVS